MRKSVLGVILLMAVQTASAAIRYEFRQTTGSDMDGSLTMRIAAPDRLDACYTHSALSPSQSIVASCGALQRAGR